MKFSFLFFDARLNDGKHHFGSIGSIWATESGLTSHLRQCGRYER